MNFLSRSSRATGPNTRVPTGSPVVVDQHRGIVVEADVAAVLAALLLAHAHDHRLHDLALLDGVSGVASFTEAVMMSPSRA